MQVNILDAKNRLSELVRRVQGGEPVVLANRGRPVARLVPVEPPAPADEGLMAWLDRTPWPASARRGSAEIDADIARERDAWD